MKEMTTQEIVKNSDYIKSSKQDWQKVYAGLMMIVQQNLGKVIRSGNTLFVIDPVSDSEVEYMVLNADSEKNYKENFSKFMSGMRNAGFTSVKEA